MHALAAAGTALWRANKQQNSNNGCGPPGYGWACTLSE